MQRKILKGLQSYQYEHPFDKKALDTLKSYKFLETLVRTFNAQGIERLLRIQYTGSNVKVNDRNFPEIYYILCEACSILDMPFVPKLYIRWSYGINAMTAGVEDPIIVLNSGAVDLLTKEELLFVLGHELGHIKSMHVLYHQMAQVFPILGEIVGSITLGAGKLLSAGLQIALLNWVRMSEFTADRAGLLTCQDPEVAAVALMKLAGTPKKYFDKINVNEFINQAKEFEDYDYDTLDKVAKYLSIMWQDHPWTVMRASELFKWVESGEYESIMKDYGEKIA